MTIELERRQFLERLGEAFLLAVLEEYDGVLQSLGSDLFGFLQNLGSIFQEMKSSGMMTISSSGDGNGASDGGVITNRYDISFSCVPEQHKLTLHFRTAVPACGYLWAGILKVDCMSNVPTELTKMKPAISSCISAFQTLILSSP